MLLCDATHSRFVLAREGENWRREFKTLQEPLDYVAGMVTEEVSLTVYNELGRSIIETAVNPSASAPPAPVDA